jgi:hypothetical protein
LSTERGGNLTAAYRRSLRVAQGAVLPALSVLSVFSVFSVFSVLSALPIAAQTIQAEGRVQKRDSTPVPRARVVLHRVGQALQGPLDSVNSDRQGRFRFAFRADTAALYILSARYAGIEYFSLPVHTNPGRPDTALRIMVYDTSSAAPVSVEARHLVVARPGEDGSRNVLDLIVLLNDGDRTRIAPDSLRPSWSGLLPRGTIGLELGESDVSPDAVTRRGDSLIVTAPLPPGEKQITVEYLIPAGHEVLELPVTEPVSMLNVLAEEKDAVVSGGTLSLADSQVLQGRSFRRWTGLVPAGSSVRVTLPGRRRAPEWLLAALVAPLVLVLAGTAWYFTGKRWHERQVSADGLLDAVAALDARYLGREAETPAEEWRRYHSERARLKALLESSLAARGPNR